jgi:hypothetical protein
MEGLCGFEVFQDWCGGPYTIANGACVAILMFVRRIEWFRC